MLFGELTYDNERVMLDIMHNNTGFVIVDSEVHFTVNGKQHIVCVSYMKKPIDRLSFNDGEQEVVAKRCVIIQLNGIKIPIFKNGIMYTNIFFPGTNIQHLIFIKNKVAGNFYNFISSIMNE